MREQKGTAQETLVVPGLKSLSPHKAFPSSQSCLLRGDFRGFAKAVHFAEQIFPPLSIGGPDESSLPDCIVLTEEQRR